MADLKYEFGNPIQLTDRNPMHLRGVAQQHQLKPEREGREHRHSGSSSSSSSSSSEDDRQGGRRKKKGLEEKIKEELPGRKHIEGNDNPEGRETSGAAGEVEQKHHEHHEKKSVMDKIKEKLPGHHGSSH